MYIFFRCHMLDCCELTAINGTQLDKHMYRYDVRYATVSSSMYASFFLFIGIPNSCFVVYADHALITCSLFTNKNLENG